MKVHDKQYFTCTISATCPHKTSSWAMHTEHVKHGHSKKCQFKCDFCSMYFRTPTQAKSHQWKVHRCLDKM